MSGVDVTVTTDLSGIEAVLSGSAVQAAQALLVQTVLDDCATYVPYREGYLEGNTETSEDEIKWTEEYAHRVYNLDESSIHTDKKGTARPQWFEYAKSVHLDDWVQVAGMALTGGGK